jgi:hypothetical protein
MVLNITAHVSGRSIVVMPDIMAVQGQFRQIRTKDLEARRSGKIPEARTEISCLSDAQMV